MPAHRAGEALHGVNVNRKPLSLPEIDARRIAAMQGHKPGRVITHPDGTRYQVTATGAWMRITPRRHEAE